MNLREAFEALLEGKKIRYKKAKPGTYMYMKDGKLIDQDNMNIALFDVWTEYEEYITLVDFNKAMQHVANGGKAKRVRWKVVILINEKHDLIFLSEDENEKYQFKFSKDDLLANDWILL